jgi:hypothetical protein
VDNDEKSSNIPDPVAALDQIGAMLGNYAVIFGQYYKSLIDNGIPAYLADKMVSDVQGEFILKAFRR